MFFVLLTVNNSKQRSEKKLTLNLVFLRLLSSYYGFVDVIFFDSKITENSTKSQHMYLLFLFRTLLADRNTKNISCPMKTILLQYVKRQTRDPARIQI